MLFLLAVACLPPAADPSAPPDVDEPDISVVLDMEGFSLGEMRGGFGNVESRPATEDQEALHRVQVVLTTYPDPCDALTGFYEELTAALVDPDPSQDWDEVVEDAATRFPSEPYDTIYLYYAAFGERQDLIGDEDQPQVLIEAGRIGYGPYAVLNSVEGASNLSALDPAIGDGEATIVDASIAYPDDAGTLTFSFEVPACPEYPPAIRAYQEAQPTE
jgi:hypothetical protein